MIRSFAGFGMTKQPRKNTGDRVRDSSRIRKAYYFSETLITNHDCVFLEQDSARLLLKLMRVLWRQLISAQNGYG
jgi:hypothetical protein